MKAIETTTKNLDFSTWMRENFRSYQGGALRQIGLWSFTLSVAVFVAPRLM